MSEKPIVSSTVDSRLKITERRQSERRRHERFPFCVEADAVEPKSNAKTRGRTSDVSEGGCYVDTICPFPIGTLVKLRLTKGDVSFDSDAEVRVSQTGMGMGIAFVSSLPQQLRIFQKWINDLSSKSSSDVGTAEQFLERSSEVVIVENSKEQSFVLRELVISLMRKEILTDREGNALLQRLCR